MRSHPHTFRPTPEVAAMLAARVALTGQTQSDVITRALELGLHILDIIDVQDRGGDDVTSTVNRIAAALSSAPPVDRRSGTDRRRAQQQAHATPQACACCCASIRPAPGIPAYYRPVPDQAAGELGERVCPTCFRCCPPGHRHPASESPTLVLGHLEIPGQTSITDAGDDR